MAVLCDYCGETAVKIKGLKLYPHRKDLHHLDFWSCEPCGAYVGCHKNSNAVPLGRLANANLRRAKSAAHAAFDPIWKNGAMSRKQAYAWLALKLNINEEKCHIGMFDEDTCMKVINICSY